MLIAAGQTPLFTKPRPAYTPTAGSNVSMASILAVRKPIFAPRPAPCTTMPRIRYGSVSNSRASATSPAAASFRTRELETISPSIHHRLDYFQLDAGIGRELSQHFDRAGATAAEVKIRPFDHGPCVELLADDLFEKILGPKAAAAPRRSDRRSRRRRRAWPATAPCDRSRSTAAAPARAAGCAPDADRT